MITVCNVKIDLLFYKIEMLLEHTHTSVAEHSQLETLKWLHSQGCPWNEWMCYKATLNCHLEVLQWAKSEGCLWDEPACKAAASSGHLHVLQWVHKQGCPWGAKPNLMARQKAYILTFIQITSQVISQ